MRDIFMALIGAFIALVAAGLALHHYNLTPKSEEPRYSLVLTLTDGSEYQLDHTLTREDCSTRLVALFGTEDLKGVECKAD